MPLPFGIALFSSAPPPCPLTTPHQLHPHHRTLQAHWHLLTHTLPTQEHMPTWLKHLYALLRYINTAVWKDMKLMVGQE